MDLISTAVLPAGPVATSYLLVASIFNSIYTDNTVALLNFVVVIFMSAILVFLTKRRWNYMIWMLIYLAALPIWKSILPLYAFWHLNVSVGARLEK